MYDFTYKTLAEKKVCGETRNFWKVWVLQTEAFILGERQWGDILQGRFLP